MPPKVEVPKARHDITPKVEIPKVQVIYHQKYTTKSGNAKGTNDIQPKVWVPKAQNDRKCQRQRPEGKERNRHELMPPKAEVPKAQSDIP